MYIYISRQDTKKDIFGDLMAKERERERERETEGRQGGGRKRKRERARQGDIEWE